VGEDRSAHDALDHVDLSWVVTGRHHSASQRAETQLARAGQNAGPSRPAHCARPAERIGWKAYRGAHVEIFGATALSETDPDLAELLAEDYPYYSASGFIGLGGW